MSRIGNAINKWVDARIDRLAQAIVAGVGDRVMSDFDEVTRMIERM